MVCFRAYNASLSPADAAWYYFQSHLSVCMSVCNSITVENLDQVSSFVLINGHVVASEYVCHVHIQRLSGQGQGHRSKNLSVCSVWALNLGDEHCGCGLQCTSDCLCLTSRKVLMRSELDG